MEPRLAEKPFLELERRYGAAPEKVWRAWTDPQAIKRWWGPGTPHDPVSLAELDVRPGGRFRIVFGGPQGTDHEVRGVYREVLPASASRAGKLVFTWTWPNSTPERESLVTLLFKPDGGGTALAFRHEQLFDEAVREGHRRGWTESLAKLDVFLKND